MGVRFVPRWEIPIWPIRWPPIRLFYHLYSIRGCCCTRGPEYTFAFAIRIITFFPDEVFTRWSRRTCFPDGPDGLVCPMGPMSSCSICHLEARFPMGSFPDGPMGFPIRKTLAIWGGRSDGNFLNEASLEPRASKEREFPIFAPRTLKGWWPAVASY